MIMTHSGYIEVLHACPFIEHTSYSACDVHTEYKYYVQEFHTEQRYICTY